ncbi:MAG: hypothetical protein SP1CHLAM54_15350 [Chlamydiia bacterium]|nr:hypothetical protein [Chlamydiia bacterium]MCH9616425.1 hypothetical protein [Chlamydiia bacterium]MCH9629589.1 hypothetical protein [Chlamydiia bacterium]
MKKMYLILIATFSLYSVQAQNYPEPYNSVEEVLPFDGFGWFGPHNQVMLTKFIQERKVHTVVELGSLLGLSTRFIANLLPPDGVVYAVDHWKGSAEHQNPSRTDIYPKLPTLYQQFLSNVIRTGLYKKIIPMRMTTQEAAEVIDVIPDLIFVDASHDFDSVVADLELWFPFIQGHGIILGDDWNWGAPDFPVRRAVQFFAQKYGMKARNYDSCWWIEE